MCMMQLRAFSLRVRSVVRMSSVTSQRSWMVRAEQMFCLQSVRELKEDEYFQQFRKERLEIGLLFFLNFGIQGWFSGSRVNFQKIAGFITAVCKRTTTWGSSWWNSMWVERTIPSMAKRTETATVRVNRNCPCLFKLFSKPPSWNHSRNAYHKISPFTWNDQLWSINKYCSLSLSPSKQLYIHTHTFAHSHPRSPNQIQQVKLGKQECFEDLSNIYHSVNFKSEGYRKICLDLM